MAKKILVVDDEQGIREAIRDALIISGYSADTAADGEEAMRRVAQEEYALILSDMHYPAFDEFIDNVAGKYPIVAMTGNKLDSPDTIELQRRMDAAEILSKPFRTSNLREAVGRHYPKE